MAKKRRFGPWATALYACLALLFFRAEASPSQIYRLTISLTTTSDWTYVGFKEAGIGAFIGAIKEGSNAPELWIKRGPRLGILKRGYDPTKVVVEFDVYIDLERLQQSSLTLVIDKGWLNSTTAVLTNQNSAAAKLIASYKHDGVADPQDPNNRREFSVPLDKIKEGGPLPYRSFDKMVLSFYYPWFGAPSGPTGFWHQWVPGLPRYGAAHTPVDGFYDSFDEAILRRQIKEAHEAGIDGFIASWWGRGSFEDRAFRNLLAIAEDQFFSMSVYYEIANTTDQVVADIKYILQEYGQSPSFLKIDDVPVVFIYGRVILEFGKNEWTAVFQRLKQEGVRCFLVADGLEDDLFVGDGSLDFLFDLFQGVHSYIAVSLDQTSIRDLNTVNSARAKGKNVVFAATVVPGYDDTLIRVPGFKQERSDGAYYRQRWDAADAGAADWILVTTFNEWHEGTEIEPSLELGSQYLTMTRDLGNVWNPQKKLRIMTRAGGTTDPAPGTYIYTAGQEAAVTAVPDPYYDFQSWTGDASGSQNPGRIILDVNRFMIANFVKIQPPLNAVGTRVMNRSLGQVEYINVFSWNANPLNANVAYYKVYLVENGLKMLLGTSGPDERKFQHRKVNKTKEYTYWIVAVTSSSREGEPGILTVR